MPIKRKGTWHMISEITLISGIDPKSKIMNRFEEEFKKILNNKLISTKFQPIVCLTTGDIVGYEALSRGPETSIFENPLYLFDVAEKLKLLENLDMLCREKAIFHANKLSLNTKVTKLFINIDAACLTYTNHNKGETKSLIEKFGFKIDNIVLEITERTLIRDSNLFYQTLAYYQMQGFSIAIDDLGSGNTGLKHISEANPQIVKIDKSLVENINKSFKKQAVFKMIVDMCHKVFHSTVVAEGIETVDELITVKELGDRKSVV